MLNYFLKHLRIFRLLMKGKFDAYVHWPLAIRVQNSRPVYCLRLYGKLKSKKEKSEPKWLYSLVTLWSRFEIDHSPEGRNSTRCAICVYLQDKCWVRKRFLLFFPAKALKIVTRQALNNAMYCHLKSYLYCRNHETSWNHNILFSVSLSVSFCMFPCSKGHIIRAYLDTI